MVQHMDPVCPFRWLPIMHYVGNEVIGCVLVHSLYFLREVFPEIHIPVAEKEATIRAVLNLLCNYKTLQLRFPHMEYHQLVLFVSLPSGESPCPLYTGFVHHRNPVLAVFLQEVAPSTTFRTPLC